MNIQSINSIPSNISGNAKHSAAYTPAKYTPSFEGKGGKKEASAFTKWVGKTYGKAILNSNGVRKFSEWLASVDKTNATKHFAVAGSLVTSSAYAYNTLKNNRLEKKNSRTLATNQALGFIVPTVLGYTIDAAIGKYTKEVEYKFAAKLEKALFHSKLEGEALESAIKRCSKQIKGVRTLAGIATFTLLYRYIAPVAITPAANKIGEKINSRKDIQALDAGRG